MRTVSNEERRAKLGIRHSLAQPAADVVRAADSMVALHSSDPVTVYLSARARVPGFKQGDLEHDLYETKSLVRILAMRRTMFVVPLEMAPILHNSSTVALIGPERRRLERWVEEFEIAEDGPAWVADVSSKTLSALEKRGEAVAVELTKDVPELGEKITFYKSDGSVLSTVGMSTRILFLLATEGRVVRGRPKGTWVSSMYRWAPMEKWLGSPMPEIPKAQAQEIVLRKWLTSFGPGTELDMKWWTGWPVTQVRAALASLGAIEVILEDDGKGHVLPDDIEPVEAPDPWVAFLPSLDPTTMGWKERDWYLGPHASRLFDRSGNAGQTIWVDGKIVGGWGQTKDAEVRWALLEDVGTETVAEIERQAGELGSWLEDKAVIPRFAAPLDRELSAR
jgi:hypothetical protein